MALWTWRLKGQNKLCSDIYTRCCMFHIFTASYRFVSRPSSGFHSSSCSSLSTLPQSSMRVLSPPVVLLKNSSSFLSPTELPRGVTSPPDSEAYYGETDSDADTHSHVHQRRQRRTSPHARSPARYDNQEEETSEMSGWDLGTPGGGQCWMTLLNFF